jgi:MscS family membrane protein
MDWNEFIDIREEITYKIVSIVESYGAEFAFPSTSVYFHQSDVVGKEQHKEPFQPTSDLE